MASNQIPERSNRLFALAEDAADGAKTHGAVIKLQQNTATAIEADLAAATDGESEFQEARRKKASASTASQIADSNAKAFLAAYKKVLSISLGNEWSAAWAPAGWPGPTLQLPATIDARLGMLPLAKAYLIANSAKENAGLGITAAAAQAIAAALSAARSSVNSANTAAGQKKAIRNATLASLRQRLIGLVDELDQLIEGDDPRWYAFGLNRPDDPSTPAVPAELVLTPGGPGIVLVDWADARRAERYKVEKLLVGVDADWNEAASVIDSDTTLAGLPSAKTLKVRVVAANKAGDSSPSEPAEIIVP